MSDSIEKTLSKKVATKTATKKVATKKVARKKTATKRAKKSEGEKDLFQAYIDKIKMARQNSEEIVSAYISEDKSSLVVNLIWEAIFDYFCRIDKEEISPSNLNTLAGVVQKLLSTSKDLNPKASASSISAQALAEIEDKLNLL